MDGVVCAQDSPDAATARSIPDTPGGNQRTINHKGVTMRFGNWRGVALALAVATGCAASARADFPCVIPRLVPAVDLNTGGPYYMPAVPYGHYAGKDLAGAFSKHLGCGHCGGLFHHGCGHCGGKGCGHCGGKGCGDDGCGTCGGHKFFHGHDGGLCGGGLCGGGGFGHHKAKDCGGCTGNAGHDGGLCGGGGFGHHKAKDCGGCVGNAVAYGPVVATSPQCGEPGCGIGGLHSHGLGESCGHCGGTGCGHCRGRHWGHHKGHDPCGDPGCGLCHGTHGGKGCGHCGGAGCKHCLGLHALLGGNRVKYFRGAGGPVPLTPGYVPYVVTTRSPRDFFAFPPFSQLDP
jgi:hypothetical protein